MGCHEASASLKGGGTCAGKAAQRPDAPSPDTAAHTPPSAACMGCGAWDVPGRDRPGAPVWSWGATAHGRTPTTARGDPPGRHWARGRAPQTPTVPHTLGGRCRRGSAWPLAAQRARPPRRGRDACPHARRAPLCWWLEHPGRDVRRRPPLQRPDGSRALRRSAWPLRGLGGG
jgi:hypothetical protein